MSINFRHRMQGIRELTSVQILCLEKIVQAAGALLSGLLLIFIFPRFDRVLLVSEPAFYTRHDDIFAAYFIVLSIFLCLAALLASVAPLRIRARRQVES